VISRMTSGAACAFLFVTLTLPAQTGGSPGNPELEESLEALAHSASNFAASAPGLLAEETLDQRGRRGFLDVVKGTIAKPKAIDVRLPDDFRTHRVLSSYGFAQMGENRALHELRKIVSIDGQTVSDAGEARHAMTIGILAADDRTKRQLLENFEHEQLEGAITDFGQLILLFSKRSQSDYLFTYAPAAQLGDEPAVVLAYRQISGTQGLTTFDQRTEDRQMTGGQIWFRQRDLLPLRITLNTERMISKKDAVRTEATVEYVPSPVGLVPASVNQKQFLNSDLLVENDLHYANFQRPGLPDLIP
jgi:hypothetical protein